MYQPDEARVLKGLPALLHFHMWCLLQLRHLHSTFIGAEFTAKWHGLTKSGEDSIHDPAGDSFVLFCYFKHQDQRRLNWSRLWTVGDFKHQVWFGFDSSTHMHATDCSSAVCRQKLYQRVFAYKFKFYPAFIFLTICQDLSPEWISKPSTQQMQWHYLITKLLICFYLLWYHEESERRCWSYMVCEWHHYKQG